jgi:hypothetical protein
MARPWHKQNWNFNDILPELSDQELDSLNKNDNDYKNSSSFLSGEVHENFSQSSYRAKKLHYTSILNAQINLVPHVISDPMDCEDIVFPRKQ